MLTAMVHRLVGGAFLLRDEERHQIDHINRIRTDNRLVNLRYSTVAENSHNVTPRGASCFRGVTPRGDKWEASIRVNGVKTYKGMLHTEEEAARAYDAAALEHYGDRASLNFPIM
jgi:hypothetical protein